MSRRSPGSPIARCGASRSRRRAAPKLAQAIARQLDAVWFLDWGGGLVWLAVAEPGDAGAAVIRAAIRGAGWARHRSRDPGRAARPALRRAVPVFEPQPPRSPRLSRRVKDGFDPRHILNPGRMVERS